MKSVLIFIVLLALHGVFALGIVYVVCFVFLKMLEKITNNDQ